MDEKHPLLRYGTYELALSSIPGFQELKNEQSSHHYEITTEILPADVAGLTVKKLQRQLRHSINPQLPLETETELDNTLGKAIHDLHQRIQSEFGLTVDIGCEWEFKARPKADNEREFVLDERAYDGTAGSNSLHVNISLKDKDNTPAMLTTFHDGKSHVNRLCFNIASGLRDILEATPLWSATDANSFRRFSKGYGSPKSYDIGLGKDGIGAVMIRSYRGMQGPDPDDYDRSYAYIENRIPAGDVDPQIAIFQSLLGVYHGLNREKFLLADADRVEQMTSQQFLDTLQKYGFHGTIEEYLANWELPSFEAALQIEKDRLLDQTKQASDPKDQPFGRGVRGLTTPDTVDKAREMQQSSDTVDYYVRNNVITQDTVNRIASEMTNQRTPSDGSSRAKTKQD